METTTVSKPKMAHKIEFTEDKFNYINELLQERIKDIECIILEGRRNKVFPMPSKVEQSYRKEIHLILSLLSEEFSGI